MYSYILFSTNDGDCADAALDHAIEHAHTYDTTLMALYVADVRGVDYAAPALSPERAREALLESSEQALGRVARTVRRAGAGIETVVTEGTSASEIIRHADERKVDLVVMGTHGRSGINRYLIGSVAEHVACGSDAPALTVRRESP